MIENFKKIKNNISCIYVYFREYRLKILLAITLVFIYCVMEMAGISVMLTVFVRFMEKSSMTAQTVAIFDKIIEYILSIFSAQPSLLNLCILVAVFFACKSIVEFIARYYQIYLAQKYEETTKNKMFNSIMNLKWQYYINYKKGYLLDYLIQHIVKVQLLLFSIIKEMTNYIYVAVFIAASFVISIKITFAASIVLALMLFIIIPVAKKIKEYGSKRVKAQKEFASLIQQYLTGFKVVRAYNISDRVSGAIKHQTKQVCGLQVKMDKWENASRISIQYIVILMVLCFIYVSVKLMGMPIAKVVVIAAFFSKIIQKANGLTGLHKITQSVPSLIHVSNAMDDFSRQQEESPPLHEKIVINNGIKVEGLTFGYNKDVQILKDINFEVKKNESLGITGPSGVGKTTLVDILLGILKYTEGDILVDGRSLNDIGLSNWLNIVGYVPQESFLMDDTVYNNIAFFRDVEKEDIIRAAKLADADEFINSIKDGYDTIVGDNGVKLSGGQRQRLVIARALACRPQVLILDEATSELDSASEQQIQKTFENLKGKMTIISIAHRLSTIINADNIIVLEDGKILEKGSRDTLLSKDSKLKEIYSQQTQRKE
ncbi:ABC transporter ATP-binding protein [Elusimicrobiota bacterium]